MRPFQRLGHLIEGAGELAQLSLPVGKPAAHAQLPACDSFRRSNEGLDLAHDKQISTHPGGGKREAGNERERHKIAYENPVRAGKRDSGRNANNYVCVRALRGLTERRKRKEARDAVLTPTLGRAVTLLTRNSVEDERLRQGFTYPFCLVRETGQDRAVPVDHSKHRPRRQSHSGGQFVEPGQIKRGEEHGLDMTPVEDGMAAIVAAAKGGQAPSVALSVMRPI